MKIKSLICAFGAVALLTGCTQSNIVRPGEGTQQTTSAQQDGSGATETTAYVPTPNFGKFNNVEIDEVQLNEDIYNLYVDDDMYPVASQLLADLNLDDGYVEVIVVVQDGTSKEDAAEYAMIGIKGVNDEVAVQDFNYGSSGDDTYGGLYQDHKIKVEIYEESVYEAKGEPMYKHTIEKDDYELIVIE